jgi:chromosome segregation protein
MQGLGLDVVTPGGDVFRRDGFVRLGIPEEGFGGVDRSALLEEAREEIRAVDEQLSCSAESCEAARERLSELEEKVEAARLTLSEHEQSVAAGSRALEILRSSLDASKSELKELESNRLSIEERLRKSAAEDSGTEAGEESLEGLMVLEKSTAGKVSELERELGSLQNRLGEGMRRSSECNLQLASLRAERESVQKEAERTASDCESAEEMVARLNERSGNALTEAESLLQEIEVARKSLESLGAKREEVEEKRSVTARERASLLEERNGTESELSKSRDLLLEIKSSIAELSTENRILLDRMKAEGVASGKQLPDESDPAWDMDRQTLVGEIEKVELRLEGMGPVNMLAAGEYEEVGERLKYLRSQRDDLIEARSSLLEAISEINETASDRFSETFAQVRGNFRELFERLFDCGQADIIPVEGEDPLEGGVQIVAMPSGKKLENVSALSGGERAMTAVALLFALYLVKPSPFCVLDELDAPLDDSNVDRFVDLVRGFSDRTQFIVITHNKRTMEAADRLFGITMAEDGVSTMASVDMKDFGEGD